MRNTYLAKVPIQIDGQRLTIQFDYEALGAIRTEIGDDDKLLALLRGVDPTAFSVLVAIGLHRNHPDWTAERVFKAAPPIRPTVAVVEEALNFLYFGPDGPPKEALENPLMRILRKTFGRSIRSPRPSVSRAAAE